MRAQADVVEVSALGCQLLDEVRVDGCQGVPGERACRYPALVRHEDHRHPEGVEPCHGLGSAGEQLEVAECAIAGLEDVERAVTVEQDGVEATRRICASGDRPRVLVLTTFGVDDLVLAAVGAGARGFLLKDAEPEAVLDGIRALHAGRAVLAPEVTPVVVDALRTTPAPNPFASVLTPRETEVLGLIARGLTNKEIAETLVVAETTVKTHVSALLLKLDARDRVALVVLAHSAGLAGGSTPALDAIAD